MYDRGGIVMKIKYINFQREKTNIRCKVYYPNDMVMNSMVIFVHGFAGHKDNKAAERLADKLLSKNKGFALMTFDLPCHGEDVRKKISMSDCMMYYDVVVHDAKEVLGAEKLYLNATSFGAFLTLKYISEMGNPFEKIVLRSPAINMFKVMSSSLVDEGVREKLDKKKEAEIGFDRKITVTQQFLDDIESTRLSDIDFMDYADDIMIMHGTKDEIAPFEDARKFCDDNVIEFVPVEDADHRYKDLKKMEYANAITLSFYGL